MEMMDFALMTMNVVLKMMDFALKAMNVVSNMMDFALNTMEFALKTTDCLGLPPRRASRRFVCALKMMNFVFKNDGFIL